MPGVRLPTTSRPAGPAAMLLLWLDPIRLVHWSRLGFLARCLGSPLPAFPAPGKGVVWDEAAMAKLQPQHHAGWVVLCVLDRSAGNPVVHLGQRPTRTQPAAGGRQLSLAVLDQHPGELAVRIPPATDVRGPDHIPDPPQQPRVQRQRRPDATVARPDREAAQSP